MNGYEEMLIKTISKDLREIKTTLKSIDKRLARNERASFPEYEYIPDTERMGYDPRDCQSSQPEDLAE